MATLLPACPDCSPDCYNYIQATVCSGQADGAPDVWVKVPDPIPSPSTRSFNFRNWCYSIDYSATPGAPPQGAVILASVVNQDDCSACMDTTGGNGSGGSGGGGDGGDGGGGGGGDGGGGGGGDGPGGGGGGGIPPKGLPAYGPLKNIWVPCPPNGETEGECWIKYQGQCYKVQFGECQDIPENAIIVPYITCYESQEDCEGGAAMVICPNQYFWKTPKQVWVRKSDIPTTTIVKRINDVCYSISPGAYTGDIPKNAIIVKPTVEFSSCDDCISGAMAVPCEGQDGTPPLLWIPAGKLPASGTQYFNAYGFCYSIASNAELVSRPATATIYAACTSAYESCADCLCGPAASTRLGVKVRRCDGGGRASLPDLWVEECNLPPEQLIWAYNGVCVRVNPLETPKPIPSSAFLTVPYDQYKSCFDCKANQTPQNPDCPNGQHWNGSQCVDDDDPTPCAEGWHWSGSECVPDEPDDHDCPDGEYWDGMACVDISEPCADGYYWNGIQCVANPPPGTDPGCAAGYTYNPDTGKCEPNTTPPPPGEPPPPTPPDDDWDQLQLKDCRTGSLVSKYVSRYSGAAGKIIRDGTSCYEVTSLRSMGGGDTSGPLYYSCSHCLADVQFIQYLKCSDDSASTYYARVIDWIQSGKSVKKIGDDCYYINAANTRVDELPTGGTDEGAPDKISCDDSDCQVYDCDSATPCHGCCFSSESTVSGDVSYSSQTWMSSGCPGTADFSSSWRIRFNTPAVNKYKATGGTSSGGWVATGVDYWVDGVQQTNDQTEDGTFYAAISVNCDTGKWGVAVYKNWDGLNFSNSVGSSGALDGDCCGTSEFDTGCESSFGSSHTTLTGTFTVSNNHCCNDSGTCTKADGDCAGSCNPLP